MKDKEFIELAYEIAFGDNAVNRDFSKEEVLKELRKFSDLALYAEQHLSVNGKIFEELV